MVTDVVSWVILGVRAAARLSETARRQYIRHTRSRTITLPLPRFFTQTNEFDARAYFDGPGQHWITSPPSPTLPASQQQEIQSLIQSLPSLQPQQKDSLRQHHARCLTLDKLTANPATNTLSTDEEAFISSTTIHAWQHNPIDTLSPLQASAADLIQTCLSLQKTLQLDFSHSSPVIPVLRAFFSGLHASPPTSPTSIPPLANQLCQYALRWTASQIPASLTALPPHLERTTRNTLALATQFLADHTTNPIDSTLKQATTGFLTLLDTQPLSLPPTDSPQHDFLQWFLPQPPAIANSLQPPQLKSILRSITNAHHALLQPSSTPACSLYPLLNHLTQTLTEINATLLLPALPDYIHGLLTETISLPPSTSSDNLNPQHNLPLNFLCSTLQTLATPANPAPLPAPNSLASIALSITRLLCSQPGWQTHPPEHLTQLLESLHNTISSNLLPPHTRSSILLTAIHAACQRFELTQTRCTQEPLVASCIQTTLQTILDPNLSHASAWQLQPPQSIEKITRIILETLAHAPLTTNPIPQINQSLQLLITATTQGNAFSPHGYRRTLRSILVKPQPNPTPCESTD